MAQEAVLSGVNMIFGELNMMAIWKRKHGWIGFEAVANTVIHAVVMALFSIGLLMSSPVEAEEAERPPNIIFILADDLGYGDLGCYGQEKILTPNLDRMASEGIRFTDFYAGSTVCAPSRSVLMTGQHTGHTRIRGNARYPLRPEDRTVAELLRNQGYTTGLIGKWGLGQPESTGIPTRQGFDYFFGYLNQRHAHNYYPAYLWRNRVKVSLPNVVPGKGTFGRGWASLKAKYSHDLFVNQIIRWVDKHRKEPFFLDISLTIPHANNEATRATGNGMEVPDYGPYANKPWSHQNKGQAAMISRMDRDIGLLMERLKENGIADETLVMFSSDNGHHNEGGHTPKRFDPNGPLRGMKRDLYEGGIRVPMIAWWPGTIEPGRVTDHVAYFGDLMATAADAVGADVPAGTDSISFLPTLLGKSKEQMEHDYLYWEFYEGKTAQAVRMGKWKAVRQPMFEGNIELYNLNQDLGEENDVADKHSKLVRKVEGIMKQAHTPSPLWD